MGGYTAARLPKFREQVDKHLNVLWSIEPFKSVPELPERLRGRDPVTRERRRSDLTSPKVDTPLQMGFWGGCNPNSVQRLLTVSSTAATQYADLVAGTTAANRQILAIGNGLYAAPAGLRDRLRRQRAVR